MRRSLRTGLVTWAVLPLILALATALSPAAEYPDSGEPEPGTHLARAAAETSRRLTALNASTGSVATFHFLQEQLNQLGTSPAGVTSLSIWDEDGWPISWAGPVGIPPPAAARGGSRPPETQFAWSPASQRVWLPLGTGETLLLEAGALTGKPLAPGAASLSRPAWGHLAGLGIALTLLVWLSRRNPLTSMTELVLFSAGIWLMRGALASALAAGGALDAGAVFSPALYASQAPLGLFRSPGAALLSGLALTAQALLLLRLVPPPSLVRILLPAQRVLGVAGMAAALILATRAGRDSNLDLVGLAGEPWTAAHLAAQTGLLLTLLAPTFILVQSLSRAATSHPVLRALLLTPLLSALLFLGVAVTSEAARRELVVDNLQPLLREQVEDREEALNDSRLRLMDRGAALAADVRKALNEGTADRLAFALWQQTDLARAGYHSSLEIYDSTGALAGSFALAMPPPVPALSGELDPADEIEQERLVFATLSQQQEVLSTRFPAMDDQGEVIGAVALYVADHWANVPALMTGDEPRPWTRSHGAASALLRSAPVVSVHDVDGNLLWSPQPDPAPWQTATGDARNESGVWRDEVSAGRQVRLYHFTAGQDFYALGYQVENWIQILARLLRFVLLQIACLFTLLMAGVLLLRPLTIIRREAGELRVWFLSSWGRKLAAAVVLASIIPLLGLAVLLRAPLERQRQDSLNTLALQSLDIARRVVQDAMVAVGGDGDSRIPSDETLYWLSRVIRQDIDLFMGQQLAATSRRGLVTAGLVSPLPDAEAYRRIVLEGKQVSLPGPAQSPQASPAVSAALEQTGPGAIILRLPFRRQERAVAQAGEEVSQRADLATAAVTMLLVVAAILVGRGTTGRLRRLTAATSRLAAGDEEVRVEAGGLDELGRLTTSFNTMASSLARQRADLQSRTQTLENLVHHAPIGIVRLDRDNNVLMLNPAARRLMGNSGADASNASLTTAVAHSPYGQGLTNLVAAPRQQPSQVRTREMEPDSGGDTRLRAVVVDLPAERGDRLLLLEDITESLRSSRLAAWADMARRIAHEIKNPLTPMRLAAEHLRRVHQRQDPNLPATLEKTVATILTQVEALREIASDFSIYARLPEKRMEKLSLSDLLNETLAPYRDTAPPHLHIDLAYGQDLPQVYADPALLRRALVNLLENALQAMPQGGTLTVTAAGSNRKAVITIRDTGAGMEPATLERIFEPYFSTRDTGTGLGLAIARRTVEEHGGSLTATSEEGEGTEFVLTLPLTDGGGATG